MSNPHRLTHEFVEYIPERLEREKLYISIQFATASHLCCCGCGHEVVTPFTPTDWTLTFDGETVSLNPSIGNWSFPCRSHYWIKHNSVRWAGNWSDEQVQRGRESDMARKRREYETRDEQPVLSPPQAIAGTAAKREKHGGFWSRVFEFIRGK